MNFLLQLTDDELLKLHRYAVCDDIKDIVEKQVWKERHKFLDEQEELEIHKHLHKKWKNG